MKHAGVFHSVTELKPGDHLCCLYDNEEEHRAVLTPFLRIGLERGEKVLYIVDAHTAEEVLRYLKDDGVDVSIFLKKGQLAVLTAQNAYLKGGAFDPDSMIALLREETERALREGYTALRVTGEMTCALRGLSGSERLIEYESKLNRFFPESRCLAVCQYDQRRFDPAMLLDVLATHPVVVIGNTLYDNFYYMPPDDFLGPDLPGATLRHQLENLQRHKKVQEDLKAERDRAQKYLDIAGVIFVAIGFDQKVTLINKKGCEVLGYHEGEIVGKNWFDSFIPERIRDQIRAVFSTLMAVDVGPMECFENPVLRKDGEERVIAWHNTVVTDENGCITGTLSSGEDITERKIAEKELSDSRAELTAIVENAPLIILLVDRQRRIKKVSGAAVTFAGRRAEEMIGMRGGEALRCLHALDHPDGCGFGPFCKTCTIRCTVIDTFETGTHHKGVEVRLPFGHRGKKEELTFLVSTSLVDVSQEQMELVCIEDITERKRAEEEKEKLIHEL